MADRSDSLPQPVSVGEAYLAAILDELRLIRKELADQKAAPNVLAQSAGKKQK